MAQEYNRSMVDLESLKNYVENKSGLLVPPTIDPPANPNREARRQIMAQVKRMTRQQKRLKIREGK